MKKPNNIDDQRFLQLLEKWLKGDFTRADERAMEALAASDDFRREAWDGFQNLPENEHEKHLLALRNRLNAPVGMRAMFRALMATAASMALIAAAVWIMQPEGDKSEMAMEMKGVGDTVLLQPSSDGRLAAPQTTAPAEDIVVSSRKPDVVPQTDKATASKRYTDESFSAIQENKAQQEIVVTDNAPAMAYEERSQSTVQENQGAGPVRTDNESINVQLSTPNQMPPPSPATKDLEQSAAADQAVAASKAKRAEAKKEIPVPEKSEPSGGWKKWDAYLDKNTRLTKEAKRVGVRGTVILEFLVDEKNEPGYFVINRPLGYGCEQEAIRLVREYKWVRGKDPHVRVEVKFRL